MKKLVNLINRKKKSGIKKVIDTRIKEFETFKKKNNNELFKELVFCILTANCSAESCINVQKQLKNDVLKLNKAELSKKLRSANYRFPNIRAGYIVEARKHKNNLKSLFNSLNEADLREWIAKNIKGLGYKESSHFLRNVGFNNLAIVDFHIIDILEKNKLIKKPKTITKKVYIETEDILKQLAKKTNLDLAKLDLYLWHEETGKVLK